MPEPTLTEIVKVRLSQELLEEVKEVARADDRSVGAVVRRAIREMLERENGKAAA